MSQMSQTDAGPDAVAPANTVPPPGDGAAIELSSVSRWYGNVVAVNDISFRLDRGITGLLGPNGAGKSTILHMLAGFLAPSSGTVTVAGGAGRGRAAQ
jgi:ABC-2 type transport system ATP-binding protein